MTAATGKNAAAAGPSLVSELLATVDRFGGQTALRWRNRGGSWSEWTWDDYLARAAAFAGGLRDLGVDPGDAVALLLRNRPEFHAADAGSLLAGAVPVSLYNSSSRDQIRHLIDDCAAKMVAVDDTELLERVLAVRAAGGLRSVHAIAVVQDAAGISLPANVLGFADLLRASPVDPFESLRQTSGQDLATVVYTSGTTGDPRGACITHDNVLSAGESLRRALHLRRDELAGQRVVSYLPMAHIAERMVSHYQPMSCGLEVTTCPELGLIARYLTDVRPHIAFGVPAVWQRLHDRVVGAIGETADLSGVAGLTGLDEALHVFTGAAPIRPELIAWFRSCGIPLTEIYGLSETTGAVTRDGRPLPGVDVELAADGEVKVRGGNVFVGYLRRGTPEPAVDEHGWFATGDVGEFRDGRLVIIDRKKELIVTPAGKKVSPSQIESLLTASPLIAAAAVVGDARRYIAALIALDAPAMSEIGATEDIAAAVADHIDGVNDRLSPPERIRRWHVVAEQWTPGSELITPTGKLRRRAVEARYAAEIESLYAGAV